MPPRTIQDACNNRANSFDFFRLFFALLVIYSHSFPLLRGHTQRDPLWILTGRQMDFGETAVNGFFLISGFLITMSWLRSRGLFDFLRRRILRIYPGYAVAFLLSLLVVGPLAMANLSAYGSEFRPLNNAVRLVTLALPRLDGAFPQLVYPDLNGALWTIRYEIWCYLLVAFLGITRLLGRPGLVLTLALLAQAAYGLQRYNPIYPEIATFSLNWGGLDRILGTAFHWPRFLTFFLTGACFYLFRDRIVLRRSLFFAACFLLALSAAFLAPWRGMAFTLPLLGGYILCYLAFHSAPFLARMTAKGDLSYGTYLYAWPVQQLLILALLLNAPHLKNASWTPYLLFFAAAVLTLPLAYLSYRFVESPFLRRKHSSDGHLAPHPIPAVAASPPVG